MMSALVFQPATRRPSETRREVCEEAPYCWRRRRSSRAPIPRWRLESIGGGSQDISLGGGSANPALTALRGLNRGIPSHPSTLVLGVGGVIVGDDAITLQSVDHHIRMRDGRIVSKGSPGVRNGRKRRRCGELLRVERRTTTMRRTMVLMAVLALVAGACGGDDASLDVADAWSRPALGPNGAVYLTIDGGDADTALSGVSVSSDVAATAQLHQTVIRDDGLMGMTMIPEVEIPAGSTVMMVPGGVHVMLMELAQPLELGDTIDITLTFDDDTELAATAEVREE